MYLPARTRQRLLRKYLCSCTSKASKVSTQLPDRSSAPRERERPTRCARGMAERHIWERERYGVPGSRALASVFAHLY
jgi:hypothetical protein